MIMKAQESPKKTKESGAGINGMKGNRNSEKQKTGGKKAAGRGVSDAGRGQPSRRRRIARRGRITRGEQPAQRGRITLSGQSAEQRHAQRFPDRNHPGHRRGRGIYRRYIKRPLGFLCALTGIILLSPVLLVTALLVRVKLGSPVIFTQERPGLHEKLFKLYKFRSMSDARDADGNLLPDGERLGRFGRALRATSLDELPELINILKGDMAVVGPRPLLVDYLPRYSGRQHRRHEVRPGLTGYAQVHGRNATTWEERLARDVWYVDHVSFRQDVGIILKTAGMVLRRQGVSSETCATMEGFTGNQKAGREDR